jgi:(E)-4-hydroxy-3-methylbut-2-enyl-diphosphate synthase
VARALARRAERRWAEDGSAVPPKLSAGATFVDDFFVHARRESLSADFGGLELGARQPVRVEIDLGSLSTTGPEVVGDRLDALAKLREVKCEGVSVGVEDDSGAERVKALPAEMEARGLALPMALRIEATTLASLRTPGLECARIVVPVTPDESVAVLEEAVGTAHRQGLELEWCLVGSSSEVVALLDRVLTLSRVCELDRFLLSVESLRPTHAVRAVVARLRESGEDSLPIVLRYRRSPALSDEEALLEAALDLGPLLCDGIGDLVSLSGFDDPAQAVDLAYRILQGARLRTTRTEFISCPSCGRTLFDLEKTTARIKQRTQHLKGVKIAIMGCIVNGPGEMADADFGYVGSGVGLVTLYAGKEVVARAVPTDEATDRLIEIIRKSGRWTDPN